MTGTCDSLVPVGDLSGQLSNSELLDHPGGMDETVAKPAEGLVGVA